MLSYTHSPLYAKEKRNETDCKMDDTVDWTRVWGGATPFALFTVDGDVSLGTVLYFR